MPALRSSSTPWTWPVSEDGGIFVPDQECHCLLRFADGAYQVVAEGERLPQTPLDGIHHMARAGGGR